MTRDIHRPSFKTAQRLVQIAVSPELGELRDDMLQETIQRDVLDNEHDGRGKLVYAMGVAYLLSIALADLADELRRGPAEAA